MFQYEDHSDCREDHAVEVAPQAVKTKLSKSMGYLRCSFAYDTFGKG